MAQMRWFRMHTEARTDRKLDTLTDKQFRIWFNLLCMAAEGDDRGTINYDDEQILSLEVAQGDPEELRYTLSRLVTLRIVTLSENAITFNSFQKRQYSKPSDMPEQTRERQAKSRLNRVTARDTRDSALRHTTDTDTEKRREDTEKKHPSDVYTRDFLDFWSHWPKKGDAKLPSFKAWRNLKQDQRNAAMTAIPQWLSFYASIENRLIPNCTTWLNQARWEVEPPPIEDRKHQNGRPYGKPDFRKMAQEMRNPSREIIETTGRTK